MQYGFCKCSLGIYKLPEHVRLRFKKPIGKLYKHHEISFLLKELRNYIINNYKVISVGDKVTKTLIENDIPIKLAIIDKKERRNYISLILPEYFNKVIIAKNDAGSINFRLCKYIYECLIGEESTLMYILGEEDLVGILVILLNIEKTIMVYGQPLEGIVLCVINESLANHILEMLEVDI